MKPYNLKMTREMDLRNFAEGTALPFDRKPPLRALRSRA